MHCPGGNATNPVWKVLTSSEGISSWTPLKPKHSNPNPNPLANQLWCIYFLTPPTPLIIIPHRLPVFFESLMLLKNWCSIHARWSKSWKNQALVGRIPIAAVADPLNLKSFFTPPTPFIIPHWLSAFLKSLMPLKNWCKMLQNQSEAFHTFLWHFFQI